MKKLIYNFLIISLCIIFYIPANSFAQSSNWDDVPENISSRKYFQRYEWFYRQRSAPFDEIPVEKHFKEVQKAKAIAATESSRDLEWTNIGPSAIVSVWPSQWGKSSGRVRGLAVHPTDENTLYIGAAAGGIHKSTDGGATWQMLGDDHASLTFGAIAIDPANPDNVYAGSGEARMSFSPRMYDGHGLYKSTDAGATWTNITDGFGNQTQFSAMVVDPINNNNIYATLASGNWHLGNRNNEGVWKSTDFGETWTRVLDADDAFDVKMHPTTQDLVYASISGIGFVVSTDGGANWNTSGTGIPSGTVGRMQIDLCKSQPDIMYAHNYNSGSSQAYKSTNGGQNWSRISASNPLGGTYNGTDWANQGTYDLLVAVHPNDPDLAYFGNVEIHRTTNGQDIVPVRIPGGDGAWDSPMHTDYHIIRFAESNPDVVYVGCDGGINKSTDGGTTWMDINNGIPTIQFYRITSHPTNPDIVIGGAQDNGNYKTEDLGATHWNLTTTGDGMACFFDYSNPNIVYMSTQYGSLYKSTSGGDFGTYQYISPNWASRSGWLTPYWQHPTQANVIYAAGQQIWKSTNRGSNWTALTGNITGDDMNSASHSTVDPNIMMVVGSGSYTSNPNIMVSTDEGSTWTDVRDNIPGENRYIARVLCDPYVANTVYVLRSGYGSGKVYKSTDLGASFEDLSEGLPDVPTNDIFVDPELEGHIYVANDIGVYRSIDGGKSWARMYGLPYVPSTDFDYVKIAGVRYLRLGTYGRSAYQTILNNSDATFFDFAGPLGGEVWVVGTDQKIQWSSNNAGNVNIYSSVDDGANWDLIEGNYSTDSQFYEFTITQDMIGEVKFKVEEVSQQFSAESVDPVVIKGLEMPELVYPENNSIGLSTELEFEWTAVTGAYTYQLQISSDDTFTNLFLDTDTINTNIYTVSGLEGNTDYFYRIKAKNTGAETDFTTAYKFGTEMSAPFLLLPENNAENIELNVTLNWENVNGAEEYLFQLARSSTFFSLVAEETLTDTFFNAVDLLENKNYYWRVKALRTGNESSFSDKFKFRTLTITDLNEFDAIPDEFTVLQNYPNPFNPSTNIRFGLPASGYVRVAGYNMLGEKIADIFDGNMAEGFHSVSWNAGNLSSGVYIVKIDYRSAENVQNQINLKVMLMK